MRDCNNLGKILRLHRENNNMLLREVASIIEIDTAYLSKIELGIRFPKKNQIIELARIYKIDLDELIAIWLAEKIIDVLDNEKQAKTALRIANERLENG